MLVIFLKIGVLFLERLETNVYIKNLFVKITYKFAENGILYVEKINLYLDNKVKHVKNKV